MVVLTELWPGKTDSRCFSPCKKTFSLTVMKGSNRVSLTPAGQERCHTNGFVFSSATGRLGGHNHINCGEKFMLSNLSIVFI